MRRLLGIGGELCDGQALTLLSQRRCPGCFGQGNGVVELFTENVKGMISESLM